MTDAASVCEQKRTRYGYTCGDPAPYLVGLPGEPGSPSCAQHLAKAVRAQAARHGTDTVLVHIPSDT